MSRSLLKSSSKSDLLRSEGNQLYAQKKFYDALLKYNESLCVAEPDTVQLGLAYANRSAVYFETKIYDKCANNIKLAKKNCYPEENVETLEKREEKCFNFIKQRNDDLKSNEPQSYLKLTRPASKKNPFISECLELKSDKKYGRHIVTNKALKVGDVVAIDEPFCHFIHRRFIHQRCTGCFNDNLLDLIPCHGCTKGDLYFTVD